MVTLIRCFTIGVVFLFYTSANAQCRSDMDCKGNRICVTGTCANPPATNSAAPAAAPDTTAAAAPAPPPATTPAQTNPCLGVDCSGQGLCAARDNAPHCICNEGYLNDASGTQCLPEGGAAAMPPQPAAAASPQPAAVQPTGDSVAPMGTTVPAAQSDPVKPGTTQASTPANTTAGATNKNMQSAGPVSNANHARQKRLAAGHVFFWSGLALAGFGGISTGVALSAANDYNESFGSDDKSRARAFTGLMFAGFGSGLTFMTIGIILWATAPKPSGKKMSLVPAFGHNEFGLVLSGRW